MTETANRLISMSQKAKNFVSRVSNGFRRDSPNYLLNLFTALLAASFLSILLVAGTAIYWIQSSVMLENAETGIASVGRAILSAEVDHLLIENPDGTLDIGVAAADLPRMDSQMKRYLRLFSLRKIVIFNARGAIVYSTNPALIGQIEKNSKKLNYVLAQGKPSSDIEDKPFEGELHKSRYVEAYSPILDARGRVLGAFEIYMDITRTSRDIAEALMLSLGALAAVLVVCMFGLYRPMRKGTLELVAAHRDLRELALRDPLTGIHNRRYITDRVKQEFNRWRRRAFLESEKRTIGFIMIDIDHFKKINDAFGHAVGDEVIREVSRRLGEGLREYDMLARYGGEEFLIMLPNTTPREATEVAERLRWSVGDLPIVTVAGASLLVTASFGVACALYADQSEQEVIQSADQALYQAKLAGRNRAVLWTEALGN